MLHRFCVYLNVNTENLLTSVVLADRFSLPMTARTTKTALLVGLVYGGLQDAAGAARGRPIGYIEWLRGRARRSAQGDEMAAP